MTAERASCGAAGPASSGARPPRFGDVWLGWRLWRALALDRFCEDRLVEGRERAPWPAIAAILVIARLCEPASELHIAEDWYRHTVLDDLLGAPAERINDDRLYRALDRLLLRTRSESLPHTLQLTSVRCW